MFIVFYHPNYGHYKYRQEFIWYYARRAVFVDLCIGGGEMIALLEFGSCPQLAGFAVGC